MSGLFGLEGLKRGLFLTGERVILYNLRVGFSFGVCAGEDEVV